MAIDLTRRGFIGLAAAMPFARPADARAHIAYLTCGRELESTMDFAFGLSRDGDIAWRTRLPARGHGFARHAGAAVFFGRRPGAFAAVLGIERGEIRAWLKPAAGHVFAGHGVFLADGNLLASVEYAKADAAGAVSLRETHRGFREIARWPTGGVDPHEMILADGHLVVANGGIPEGFRPRHDDPALCRPSIARFDPHSARLTDFAEPDVALRRISLRHLALARGRVMIAGQDQGSPADDMPVLVEVGPGGLIHRAADCLHGYAGSIASGAGGLCLTGPRANRALVLDNAGTSHEIDLRDVCGVAPSADGFFLSGGAGDLDWTKGGARRHAGIAFDNHMLALDI
ncbi:MAG: DUF1513 domain-containing protein [Alphaproteobacteria bacterium]|nr:DUF1513 domain-containing protein [Alphaproteobacteria bacterium]